MFDLSRAPLCSKCKYKTGTYILYIVFGTIPQSQNYGPQSRNQVYFCLVFQIGPFLWTLWTKIFSLMYGNLCLISYHLRYGCPQKKILVTCRTHVVRHIYVLLYLMWPLSYYYFPFCIHCLGSLKLYCTTLPTVGHGMVVVLQVFDILWFAWLQRMSFCRKNMFPSLFKLKHYLKGFGGRNVLSGGSKTRQI